MESKCEALCEAPAKCVVAQDFDKAHALLAPWLRAAMKPSDIQRMVNDAGEGLPAPRAWTLDEGLLDLEDLRKPDSFGPPSKPIPKEISEKNYKGWLCIQFTPGATDDDGPNVCFDLWLAAVEVGGANRVGYLEAAESTRGAAQQSIEVDAEDRAAECDVSAKKDA